MNKDWVPKSGEAYSDYLQKLRVKREQVKVENKHNQRRRSLNSKERHQLLLKTGKRCHICGGVIDGYWEADHVLAHGGGGRHAIDNYLPAHKTCNSYRWYYLPEEFENILKLGVWLRTQVQKKTTIGQRAAEQFVHYEKNRAARRRK